MWIFLSDAFLSIVDERAKFRARTEPPHADDLLVVRARAAADIKRTFPGASVRHTPTNDYPFRALIQRRVVARAMAEAVFDITYGNFKATVRDDGRHGAYLGVWTQMHNWQRARAQPARRKCNPGLFDDNFAEPYGGSRRAWPTDPDDPFYVGNCT